MTGEKKLYYIYYIEVLIIPFKQANCLVNILYAQRYIQPHHQIFGCLLSYKKQLTNVVVKINSQNNII